MEELKGQQMRHKTSLRCCSHLHFDSVCKIMTHSFELCNIMTHNFELCKIMTHNFGAGVGFTCISGTLRMSQF